jgi:hypothetical protein
MDPRQYSKNSTLTDDGDWPESAPTKDSAPSAIGPATVGGSGKKGKQSGTAAFRSGSDSRPVWGLRRNHAKEFR